MFNFCDFIQVFVFTRNHHLKRQFRLDIRKYSFSQRVIDTWNNLPESVVESSFINQFKSRINDHWKRTPGKPKR